MKEKKKDSTIWKQDQSSLLWHFSEDWLHNLSGNLLTLPDSKVYFCFPKPWDLIGCFKKSWRLRVKFSTTCYFNFKTSTLMIWDAPAAIHCLAATKTEHLLIALSNSSLYPAESLSRELVFFEFLSRLRLFTTKIRSKN